METLIKACDNKSLIGLLLEQMKSGVGFMPGGLSEKEAELRLKKYGFNEIAREQPLWPVRRLWMNVKNPLVILLTILGIISFVTEIFDQQSCICNGYFRDCPALCAGNACRQCGCKS